MDDGRSIAAANNAEWCDGLCRAHGLATRFDADAWTAPTRTPRLYPDAVTLTAEVDADELLARIDTSAGCSVKDSFALLDLGPYGFEVLFDAQWVIADDVTAPAGGALRWEVVDRPEGLADWEAAWAAEGGVLGTFPAALLEHDAVTVVAGRHEHRVVAGAVLNRSERVVGTSNVFAAPEHHAAGWAGAVAFAARLAPDTRLCGYESGPALDTMVHLGFEPVGALRVWVRATEDPADMR